jgi:hypothetical protein
MRNAVVVGRGKTRNVREFATNLAMCGELKSDITKNPSVSVTGFGTRTDMFADGKTTTHKMLCHRLLLCRRRFVHIGNVYRFGRWSGFATCRYQSYGFLSMGLWV